MNVSDIKEVKMYTKRVCPYCDKAKNLLKSKGLEWTEESMEDPAIRESFMADYPTVRTVPQIFINGERIGGFDDLVKLNLQ
tara:strand:- start:976 stop:1218 length:243 start_codon:yes stop_codon:yes gene_type:complete